MSVEIGQDELEYSETAAEENEQSQADILAAKRLPYSFASANGVMLDHGKLIFIKGDLKLDVVREIRRFAGSPVEFEEVEEKDFQAMLTKFYQSSDSEAQQAAEDMDADFDLSALAEAPKR